MIVTTGNREPDPGSALEEEGMPDMSDALASKVITGDPQEDLAPPGEAPQASVDFGMTAEEEREGEPLSDLFAREEPDVTDLRGDNDDSPYPETSGAMSPEERALHV